MRLRGRANRRVANVAIDAEGADRSIGGQPSARNRQPIGASSYFLSLFRPFDLSLLTFHDVSLRDFLNIAQLVRLVPGTLDSSTTLKPKCLYSPTLGSSDVSR